MRYKSGRRFGLSVERQSLIYYLCMNYRSMDPARRDYIQTLCARCGGEWRQALFWAVTTDRRLIEVAADAGGAAPPSEATMFRLCKKFYENFDVSLFLGEREERENG